VSTPKLAYPSLPPSLLDESSLIALPTETIPNGVSLPCSVYVKVRDKYVLFRQQGEKITAQRALDLRKIKGGGALYIHEMFWNTFLRHLEQLKIPGPVTPESTALQMRHLIIAYGRELERQSGTIRKTMVANLNALASKLSSALDEDPTIGPKLLRHSNDSRLYFLNHIVNATLYANLIGRKLGLSSEDLKLLTSGVILHDIGNLFLSKRILYKNGDLTTEEMDAIKIHAREGAEFLHAAGMPSPVVLTALQHHEKYDGTGYPEKLEGNRIHIFARICAICDVFDALTSDRPYRQALSPKDALAAMKKMPGHFDPNLLVIVGYVR
jgi:HD-GYP domain-containing protein (c-di-GMP phosphodiesterase class II)